MPARRSRTERWRNLLDQIAERGGAIEIAPLRDNTTSETDVIWRVRLLQVRDQELIIECPGVAGESFSLEPGADILAVMTVGQNRWMFHTSVLGETAIPLRSGPVLACRLDMPTKVERCQRRSNFRISTAELSPPPIEIWPVLDPMSVIAAEVSNRALVAEAAASAQIGGPQLTQQRTVLPEVGPEFSAKLLNISSGGIGIATEHANMSLLNSSPLFWIMLDLTPRIAAPLGITARLAHTKLDSEQNVQCGFSFEFQYHPAHRPFIVDQISRVVGEIKRRNILEAA